MADNENRLKVGPDSFWEMTALVIDGRLASCESCVGFYYFQSEVNCRLYLDSCADAGLVEKVSLLELKAEADLDSPIARKWYDQDIYISAPRFRKLDLNFARRRIENTANAVYNAYFIYHELLGADDGAISAAYANAVEKGMLRNSEIARNRRDVNLSPIAQMRVILDGFKSKESAEDKKLPEPPRLRQWPIDQRVTNKAVDYILSWAGTQPPAAEVKSDRGEELDEFITQFLIDPFKLREFSRTKSREMSDGFHVQLLLLISELCRHRYDILSADRTAADKFVENIRKAIEQAKFHHSDDQNYLAALSDFAENLESRELPGGPFLSAITLGTTMESVAV